MKPQKVDSDDLNRDEASVEPANENSVSPANDTDQDSDIAAAPAPDDCYQPRVTD